MKNFTWKKALPVVTLAASVLVLAFLLLFDQEFRQIGPELHRVSLWCLPAALACMVLMWSFEAGILMVACRDIPGHVTYGRAFRLALIGQYYSALTPFSSGGQPMQIAYMQRWKVPTGAATTMFLLKFVYWQVLITLAAGIGVWRYFAMLTQSPGLLTAVMIGLFISVCATLAGILPLLRISVVKPLGMGVRFLGRIHVVRDQERAMEGVTQWSADFAEARRELLRRPLRQLVLLVLTAGQMVALLAVTYVLYRGFGLNGTTFEGVLLVQCILTVAVAFVPLPGAAGASEGVFYLLFATLFPRGLILAAMILWRFCTYYLHLAIGPVVLLSDQLASHRS